MHGDSAILTNPEDLTRFLTIICGKTTDAFLKDERDHTNNKIQIVVHSFAERMESLKNDYEAKIDKLEKHVNELLAEANLKTDTLSVYQNQLLFNLKSGLQGALANIDQDIRVLSNEIRTCNICSKNFGTLRDLQNHTLYEHSLHSSFQCQVCRKTFSSLSNLNVHFLEHVAHTTVDPSDLNNETSCACNICGDTFTAANDLDTHMNTQHSVTTANTTPSSEPDRGLNSTIDSDVSAILQVDGNISIPVSDGLDEITESRGPILNPMSKPVITRTAPFTLNHSKQLTKITKNASLKDFEIEITSTTNINIQCSAGFYQLVAKPVLSRLLVPKMSVMGVAITCSDPVSPKLDQLQRDVNAVIHFKVEARDKQENATVHLHHTQQKVQVQGNASHWFVDSVLRVGFEAGAKDHELNIRSLNAQLSTALPSDKVLGKGSETPKTCAHCMKNFRANTKNPTICCKCSKSFHNSRTLPCFVSHVCSGITPPSTASRHPSASSAIVSIAPTGDSTILSPLSSCTNLTSSGVAGPSTRAVPTVAVPGVLLSPSSVYSSAVTSTTVTTSRPATLSTQESSTMDPSAAPFIPCNTIEQPIKRKRSKKDNSEMLRDPKDVENEFLKRELNIVKTRLLAHESEVKDLKRKNKVLSDSVAILENEKQRELSGKAGVQPILPQAPPCSHCLQPSPSSQAQTSDPHHILDSKLINKLLNLLSDLLQHTYSGQRCSSTNKCKMSSPSPSVISPPASLTPTNASPITERSPPPNNAPTVSESLLSGSTSSPAQSGSKVNQELSDSLLTLDEFAPELLDITACSVNHGTAGIEEESLNEDVQTTQSILRLH